MNVDELQVFEAEMTADTQLKETVELQRLLVTEIQQRAFITEIIEESKGRMEKPIHITFRKIMMITWSGAAIFMGVFFVNQAYVNSRMDNPYTENYSEPQINVMRGDDLCGGDSTETDFLQAIKFLNTNQPKQALEILQ